VDSPVAGASSPAEPTELGDEESVPFGGTVVDGRGAPVAGVTVDVLYAATMPEHRHRVGSGPRVLSGADGRFTCRLLPDSQVLVTASLDGRCGHAEAWASDDPAADPRVVLGDPGLGGVHVRLTAADSPGPCAHTLVLLVPTDPRQGDTRCEPVRGHSHHATYTGLPPGTWMLRIAPYSAPWFPVERPIIVESGAYQAMEVAMVPGRAIRGQLAGPTEAIQQDIEVEIRYRWPWESVARPVSPSTGVMVSGVSSSHGPQNQGEFGLAVSTTIGVEGHMVTISVRPTAEGEFCIYGLPDQPVTLTARLRGATIATRDLGPNETEITIPVPDSPPRLRVIIEPDPAARDGDWWHLDLHAATGEQFARYAPPGELEFRDELPPGDYLIRGYRPSRESVHGVIGTAAVALGRPAELRVVPQPLATAWIAPVCAETGAALPDARLSLRWRGYSIALENQFTEGCGSAMLPPGVAFELRLEVDGREPAIVPLLLAPGARQDIDRLPLHRRP